MNVTDLKYYGMDIIRIQENVSLTLKKKLSLLSSSLEMVGGLIQQLGLKGTVQFIKQVKAEIQSAQEMDWSEMRERGISEKDLNGIIKKIVMAKVMAETLGYENAAALRRRFSQRSSYMIFEEMFAAPQVFMECGKGDFLPPFKQYYTAMMEEMERRGLEAAEIAEDTADTFQLTVTYCAWAHVAAKLGNPRYCYFSTCYGDEVFFPKLCEQAGFDFRRTGTLGTGAPVCDFRFMRQKNGTNGS